VTDRIAIIGSGVAGLLMAEQFFSRGWKVHVYEKSPSLAETSVACSYVAAAMLAPYCELEKAESIIAEWGVASLPLWKELIERWCPEAGSPIFGTFAVAFNREAGELNRLKQSIDKFDPQAAAWINSNKIHEMEPDLGSKINRALWIPQEGYLDGSLFLQTIAQKLAEKGVVFHYGVEVKKIYSHTIETAQKKETFAWVIDCRGLAAKQDLKNLRAVRGEIIRVYAPEVHLKHTIRLMHPRYPVYIVPRNNQHYVIGATSIESASDRTITVLSTLELLSAVYSLHSGFSEANIISTMVGLRPAFPDNIPKVYCDKGLMIVNGLYRHGYLVSPFLSQTVANHCEGEAITPQSKLRGRMELTFTTLEMNRFFPRELKS